VGNQQIEFTYYSENIEKHAEQNNTCHINNEEALLKNHHPIVKYIYKKYLTDSDIELLRHYRNIGRLEEDNEKFYVKDSTKQGFPRLFVRICDEQLDEVSKMINKETYKYLRTIMDKRSNKCLYTYLEDINDIKVSQIIDEKPPNIAFEKILGDMDDWDTPVMMYGNNKQTHFAAAKRQMKTAPVPDEKIVKDFLEHSKHIIEEEIGEYLNHFNYDAAQWYSHLNFMKQQKIKEIMYYYNPPPDYEMPDKDQLREILSYDYTALVKKEIQDLDGKPRMVCAIPQRIKYIMGPVTWQLEEICAKYLKGYCGGKNLTEMAEDINNYIDQGFTKVVEGDGSGFDNTQDITLKEIDRYIYNRVMNKVYHVPKQDFEKVANMHYKTMNVKIRDTKTKKLRNYIKYKVLGTVFSGDCDTTLANTIRMAMYNRYVNDKAGLRYGVDYIVFSKGDDFTVLYKPYITDEIIDNIYYRYFLKKFDGKLDDRQYGLGQIIKFLEKGNPQSIKFCSLRAWLLNDDNQHVTLTRDPSKLYKQSRYAIKTKAYNPKQLYIYHLELAVSYFINFNGIDIFTLMGNEHIKMANKIKQQYNLKLNNKDRKKIKIVNQIQYEKLFTQKEKLKVFPLYYVGEIDKNIKELMDIKGRQQWYDMYAQNYWEQVKAHELIRNEILSKEELKYVNDQIQSEFDVEELKSLIGCWA